MELKAIKVHQWLEEWSSIDSSKGAIPEYFYMFCMSAYHLRKLSGIHRRREVDSGIQKISSGVQRLHDEKRSIEISKFVRHGYPWSTLHKRKQELPEYRDLRKPGWLPTGIIANILTSDQKRNNKKLDPKLLINLEDSQDGFTNVILPNPDGLDFNSPLTPRPIEIIDGQHRLLAFDESLFTESELKNFHIPVIAFHGLTLDYQAYLFYVINIKPKRINSSLAYDLYPMLRNATWLTKDVDHKIYSETRAQELTEFMWRHPESPLQYRINMIGQKRLPEKQVSQATWVRALVNSMVGPHTPGGKSSYRFFGYLGEDVPPLPWTRAQQAAFLIITFKKLNNALLKSGNNWIKQLRKASEPDLFDEVSEVSIAFTSRYSLINSDQGLRPLLKIINDFNVYAVINNLFDFHSLGEAGTTYEGPEDSNEAYIEISNNINAIGEYCDGVLIEWITRLCDAVISFDWQSSSSPSLSEKQEYDKQRYRGSGGYTLIYSDVLHEIVKGKDEGLAEIAEVLLADELQ